MLVDLDYIKLRNSMIPQAEREAKEKAAKLENLAELRKNGRHGEYLHYFETEFFHKAMGRLTREALALSRLRN